MARARPCAGQARRGSPPAAPGDATPLMAAEVSSGRAEDRPGAGAGSRGQGRFAGADIIARERHRIDTAGELELGDHQPAMAEAHLAAGEIEFPHAAEPFVIDIADHGPPGEEALAPVAERLGI